MYCHACRSLESVQDVTPSATRTMPREVVFETGFDAVDLLGRNQSPYINVIQGTGGFRGGSPSERLHASISIEVRSVHGADDGTTNLTTSCRVTLRTPTCLRTRGSARVAHALTCRFCVHII